MRPEPFVGDVQDLAAVNAQIGLWQAALRLSDWHIAATNVEPDPDSRSNVEIDVNVRLAALRLRASTPMAQVDRQIVHELLHVLLAGMEDAFRAAKEYTPRAWDDAGNRMWHRAEESAIEALVDVLVGVPRGHWGPDEGKTWKAAFPATAQEVRS